MGEKRHSSVPFVILNHRLIPMDITTKRLWPLFLLIASFALFVSFYCFRTHPNFWFDEGIFYQVVQNWAVTGERGLPLSPTVLSDLSLVSMGYPVLLPAVLAFKIFGPGVTVIRIVAIAFLIGVLVAVFFLAKRLYGPRIALATLLLLATFSPLYGNGKSFLGEVPGLFFFLIGLIILVVLEQAKTRKIPLAFLGGVFFGFAVSAKPLFLLILPALAIGIAARPRVFLGSRQDRHAIVALFVGLGLALLVWFRTQFGVSTSPAGVFAHYANPYYVTDFWPIITNNIVRFFTESTPLLFLLQFLLAGYYFVRQRRLRGSITAGEITAFVFAALVGAAYLRTVGWYRYFFPGQVMLYLFVVPGILAMSKDIAIAKYYWRYVAPVGVLALLVVQFMPLSKNALSCTFDETTAMEPYLRALSEDEPVLFYSVPQLAARYAGAASYQYIRMSDTLQLGKENLAFLRQNFFSAVFIETDSAAKIENLLTCFRRAATVGHISMYRRNSNVSCLTP